MIRFDLGFQVLYQWLTVRQRGGTLKPFFEDNRLNRVAIYGMGELGERLLEELRSAGITVDYAIDRRTPAVDGLKVYGTEERAYPATDAVIVTPLGIYWDIVALLEAKTDAPVLAIEDVVDYCHERLGGMRE